MLLNLRALIYFLNFCFPHIFLNFLRFKLYQYIEMFFTVSFFSLRVAVYKRVVHI